MSLGSWLDDIFHNLGKIMLGEHYTMPGWQRAEGQNFLDRAVRESSEAIHNYRDSQHFQLVGRQKRFSSSRGLHLEYYTLDVNKGETEPVYLTPARTIFLVHGITDKSIPSRSSYIMPYDQSNLGRSRTQNKFRCLDQADKDEAMHKILSPFQFLFEDEQDIYFSIVQEMFSSTMTYEYPLYKSVAIANDITAYLSTVREDVGDGVPSTGSDGMKKSDIRDRLRGILGLHGYREDNHYTRDELTKDPLDPSYLGIGKTFGVEDLKTQHNTPNQPKIKLINSVAENAQS
jgi:hypothetical protein